MTCEGPMAYRMSQYYLWFAMHCIRYSKPIIINDTTQCINVFWIFYYFVFISSNIIMDAFRWKWK